MGGAQIRLSGVDPSLQANGIIAFDGFGNFFLKGSNVQVGDKLYYQGYRGSLSRRARLQPGGRGGIHFDHLDAFSMLDFCTWALEPNDKVPRLRADPDDCTAATCQQ